MHVFFVIASEAKQSLCGLFKGLLRRFAPRNDKFKLFRNSPVNKHIQVKIIRIDKTLPIPEYHTEGSVAFDLYAREDAVVAPKEIARIPGNVIIQTPHGYMLMVIPRSSTPRKYGLSIPQGIGIIDQDFCGPKDELILQLYNFTDEPVIIQRGTRLAQAVLVKIALAEFEEVDQIAPNSRGGFGSTG